MNVMKMLATKHRQSISFKGYHFMLLLAALTLCLDVSAQQLYWGNLGTNQIKRSNLDGSSVTNVLTGVSSGVAHDQSTSKVYWIDNGNSIIKSANDDGTNVQILLTGLSSARHIDVDPNTQMIYWTEFSSGKVRRANVDGTGVQDIATGRSGPFGIDLDLTNGVVYWMELNGGLVRKSDLDGSNAVTIVSGFSDGRGVAVDPTNGKVYWTIGNLGQIRQANTDGTSVTTLISGLTQPYGIAVDEAGGKLYWSQTSGSQQLRRSNLDGTSISTIITGQSNPVWINISANTSGNPCSNDTTAPVITCVNDTLYLDANGNATLDTTLFTATDNCGPVTITYSQTAFTCADVADDLDQSQLVDFFTIGGFVGVAQSFKAGKSGELYAIDIKGYHANGNTGMTMELRTGSNPIGGTVLASENFNFTGTMANYTITFSNPGVVTAGSDYVFVVLDNGAPSIPIMGSGLSNPYADGDAIQEISGSWNPNTNIDFFFNTYVASSNEVIVTATDTSGNVDSCIANISVADTTSPNVQAQDITVYLDSTGNATITASQIDNGSTDNCGIDVLSIDVSTFTCSDVSTGNSSPIATQDLSYYSNTDTTLNVLNYDGSNTVSVNYPGHGPNSAVIDRLSGKIYWVNGGSIFNSELDGSNAQTLISGIVGLNEVVVDPDAGYLFWSEYTGRRIMRANLDGTGQFQIYQDAHRNFGLEIDRNVQKVVWVQHITGASNAQIRTANYDGTAIATVGSTIWNVTDVALANNKVYFSVNVPQSGSNGYIGVRDVSNNSTSTLYTGTGNIFTMNISLDGSEIFWYEAAGGLLRKSTNTGSNVTTIATNVLGVGYLGKAAGAAPAPGSSVTLTGTDESGNSSSATAIVTVLDTFPPSLQCPSDIFVSTDSGSCDAIVNFSQPVILDSCGGEVITQITGLPSGSSFPLGTTLVAFEVADASGNTSVCDFAITVEDNEAPAIACQPVVLYLDSTGNAILDSSQVVVSVSDSCSPVTVSLSNTNFDCSYIGGGLDQSQLVDFFTIGGFVGVAQSFKAGQSGELYAIDIKGYHANGNTAMTMELRTGSNPIGGTLLASENFNFTGTMANYTINFSNPGVVTAGSDYVFVVLDNGAPSIPIMGSGLSNPYPDGDAIQEISGSWNPNTNVDFFFNTYVSSNNDVTVIATDTSGNSDSCIASITIVDTLAPVVAAQDVTIYLDSTGTATLTSSQVDNGSTDNCGIDSIYIDNSSFSCVDTGTVASCDSTGITLDGINDFIDLGNVSELAFERTDAFTIEAWILASNSSTSQTIVSKQEFSSRGYRFYSYNATSTGRGLRIHINNNYGTSGGFLDVFTTPGVDALTKGNWHHVAMTYDGSGTSAGIKLYVDGVAHATSSHGNGNSLTTTILNSTSAVIGATPFSGGLYRNSTMDEVRIWNTARSASEIQSNYNRCLDGTESGLVGYYPMTDGSGSTISDLSGSGNDGALTNANSNTAWVGGASLSGSTVLPTTTLTVVDVNGNSASQSATITVLDTINPVVSCLNDSIILDSTGTASVTIDQLLASASDNCKLSDTTISQTVFTTSDVGSNSVTISVIDGSGNIGTCIADVYVIEPAPIAVCKDTTIYLDANGTATIVADDVDGGSSSQVGLSSKSISQSSFACGDQGANSVTLTVTSTLGSSDSCTAIVTVLDTIAPVLTCPSNINVDTDPGSCDAIVSFSATASDNCGASISYSHASGSSFALGTTTVTVTAVDSAANTATCSFDITVTDSEAPVIACPANISVNNDAGSCDAVVIYATPAGTDNCTGATTVQTAGLVSGSAFPVGTTTNTFEVTDAAGNVTTCSFDVTVTDNEAPVIACPANISVNNDAGSCDAVVTYSTPVGTDNCTGATTVQTAGLASGSAFPVGTTTNTFEVTDAAGNVTTCSFDVTVTDNEAPVIACPANISVNNDAGSCDAVVTYSTPAGTDNCTGATTVQTAGLVSGSAFPVGTTTNTFEVTDAAGNVTTCSFDVTVMDNEAPVIACPANISVNNDAGSCDAVVTYSTPVGTDNCTGATTVQTAGLVSGSAFPVGTTTNTFEVTDAAGNVTTCSFDVTVTDNEAPVIACPANISVNNDAGSCDAVVTYSTPVGTDNCTGATTVQTAGLVSGSAFPVGTTTNTFEVTDAAGNVTTCSFDVTVTDNEAPTAICQNVTVSLLNGVASILPSQIDNGSSDACGIASVSLDNDTWTCQDIGDQNVTLTVTDIHGNSSACSAVVTVEGAQPTCSIASVPSNNTYTGGNPNIIYIGYGPQSTTLTPTVTGGSSFTYSWVGSNLSCNNCANPVFTPTGAGNFTFDLIVTNNNGCVTQCSIVICVRDIRVFKRGRLQNNKVYLCHVPPGNNNNPQTLSINTNAVSSHLLNHSGDALGACNTSCAPGYYTKQAGEMYIEQLEGEEIELVLYPNPSASQYSLSVEGGDDETFSVVVYDMRGKLVENVSSANGVQTVQFGEGLSPGVYLVQVTKGNYTKTLRAVKQ